MTSYPQLLPPLQGGERYGVLPPRPASWRRTANGAFFLANDVNAIPAAKVEMANIDELFLGHAEIFGEPVCQVCSMLRLRVSSTIGRRTLLSRSSPYVP